MEIVINDTNITRDGRKRTGSERYTLGAQKQEEILKVLAKFGSIEGVKFDHYVIDWDFD